MRTSPAVQNQRMLIWTDETSELPPPGMRPVSESHITSPPPLCPTCMSKRSTTWNAVICSINVSSWVTPVLTLLLPGLPNSRDTPSPIDPNSIHVPVKYEPDPADLALSSIPGQEMFDPRKCKFSAEELKPQPMIKKARKVFIPEDLKVNSWTGELEAAFVVTGRGQMSVYVVFKIKARKSFWLLHQTFTMMSLIQFNKDEIKDFSCISVVLNFSFEDLTTIKDNNAIRLNLNGLPIGVMVRLQGAYPSS